jgi:murein DD-endopeptidase MepM/ murein hydrolase activator NlpD
MDAFGRFAKIGLGIGMLALAIWLACWLGASAVTGGASAVAGDASAVTGDASAAAAHDPAAAETPAPTPTTVPFLQPPFAGQYRVTSYVDHVYPDFSWDDTIVIFNGDQASAIDGILDRTATFRGGYWFPPTYWYIYYDGHNGFDYGTGAGTTILAAAPGEVVFADSTPTSCATPLQYVCLKHEGGYRTFYLHLEGICVHAGEWVEAGDPLGISGNSGCSLGPHLHFAVEHDGYTTDPYGWQPEERPDPLIEYSGQAATWLWAPDRPPLPGGKLTHPPRDTHTNGDLFMLLVPDEDCPPIAHVEFWAWYADAWHSIGADGDGSDGWSWTWDTRGVPEGEVWLHAWVVSEDGRVGKGSPIRTDVVVDRQPPQGMIIGLEPGSTAGSRLWLYAASYDPESTTERVTFLVRESGAGDEAWREIGDATWLHTSNWLLEWEADVPDGSVLDVVARLTDGAGNATLTQPVEGITIARSMPGGELTQPRDGTPFATTLDLVFEPLDMQVVSAPAPIAQVAFDVWHDGAWHQVGVDWDGSNGWSARWDPAYVGDQARIRVQARVYDAAGRVNTALPQVTNLILDRTPPKGGFNRPATGGVARPDVPPSVWAQDTGSGVEVVEFFLNQGQGWIKIGEDRYGYDGWTGVWDGRGVEDGVVDFGARMRDKVGNEAWVADARNVALDRTPPAGGFAYPAVGALLSGTITLTLDVTDTVSGLDRAIFYARYDERWHHLGADTDREDGFALAWDTLTAAGHEDVTLTAWVYDRAGNQGEMPHVGGLAITWPSSPAQPLSRTVAGVGGEPTTVALTATLPAPETVTPTVAPPTVEKTTPPPTREETPTPTPTLTPEPTAVPPTKTPTPVPQVALLPTATHPPTATATRTPAAALTRSAALPSAPPPAVLPAYWYLLGGGTVVAVTLLALSLRRLLADQT